MSNTKQQLVKGGRLMAHRRRRSNAQLTPVRPPIAGLAIWNEARKWIDPQLGRQNNSRFPFRNDTPPDLLRRLQVLELPCASCSHKHFPVRCGRGQTVPTLYVTGGHADPHRTQGCAMKEIASQHAIWLKMDLGKIPKPVGGMPPPVPQTGSLF